MTVLSPPAFLQAGTYSALLDRIHINTIPTIRDFSVLHRGRQGFYPTRTPTFSNPGGLQIAMSACAGLVANTFATDGGDYRFSNPSSSTVTCAAASPTQNRIDLVGFQIKDNFYDASGLNQVAPAIVQGTNSAGVPTAPAVPAGFIPVVEVLINALATTPTSMTSRVVRTAPEGTPLLVSTLAERNALGTVAEGVMVDRTDRDWLERYDGAAWRVLGQVTGSSAADLSTNVTNGFTGQLAYRTDTHRLNRFVGSAFGNIMGVAQMYSNSVQSVPNTTPTAMAFDLETYDEYNGHSNVTNNTRYTPPVAGTYLVFGAVAFHNTAAGPMSANIRKNGSVVTGQPPGIMHAVNQGQIANVAQTHALIDCNGTTDYIELYGFHAFGGATNTLLGGWITGMTVVRIA